MHLYKIVAHSNYVLSTASGYYPKKGEFYASLFAKLNLFQCLFFPLLSVERSLIKSDLEYVTVPTQMVSGLIISFFLDALKGTSRFDLLPNNVNRPFLDLEYGYGRLPDSYDAAFPRFHMKGLLQTLSVILPMMLFAIPKSVEAVIPKSYQMTPSGAFCVENVNPSDPLDISCTTQERENIIRWWAQLFIGFILMTWNRIANHNIESIVKLNESTVQQYDFRNDRIVKGNVISFHMARMIDAIMNAAVIAFFYNGKIIDMSQYRRDPLNSSNKDAFYDVGRYRHGFPLVYLLPSYLNWRGIMPTGKWGWALYKSVHNDNGVKHKFVSNVKDTKSQVNYRITFGELLFTLCWVNVADRLFFLKVGDQEETRIDTKYTNAVILSLFLINQLLFCAFLKCFEKK